MLKPEVLRVFRMEGPMNLKLWYTDGEQGPVSSTNAMTSKVKGQGCKVTWSV